MNHLLGNNSIRGFHRRVDITFAGSEFVGDVVAEFFVNYVATIRSLLDIDNGRQLFIID